MPKIRILTIWFGANDACIKPSPQHVPLEKFTANLEEFVDLLHDEASPYYSPSTRIVLISPPPVNTHQRLADLQSRNPPLPLDRDFETTRLYAEAVKNVADSKGVAFLDTWTPLWEGAGKKEQDLTKYFNDGLHLNAAGYEVKRSCSMRSIMTQIMARRLFTMDLSNSLERNILKCTSITSSQRFLPGWNLLTTRPASRSERKSVKYIAYVDCNLQCKF